MLGVGAKKVIVIFDGLLLDDLYNPAYPYLNGLVNGGGGIVGLMNTAISGNRSDTAALLPLALGYLAPAVSTDNQAYMSTAETVEGDPASVVFRRRTGFEAPTSSMVHLGFAGLVHRGLADALVGSIALKLKGHPVACFGNADTDLPGRRVALFAINDRGFAAGCEVSRRVLIADSNASYGVRDNVVELARLVKGSDSGCCVVHLGDGARVEANRSQVARSVYLSQRKRALATLDGFIKMLLYEVGDCEFMVVSPRPPSNDRGQWDRLTPIVFYTYTKDGDVLALTSATTRTVGLVANIDVAPTILNWLGLKPGSKITGHAIEDIRFGDSRSRLERMDRLVLANAQSTVPLFATLAILAAVVIFGGMSAVAIGKCAAPFAFGILFLMNMPLALMLCVPLWPSQVSQLLAYALLIMLALTITESAAGKRLGSPPLIVAILTGAAVIVDALFGQPLVKFSLFSAYQLQGIRFYGIGNEYMGVLIGVTLLAAFLLPGRLQWKGAMFLVTTFVLGYPGLGANAGGFIASVVAFAVAWRILTGRTASWKIAAMASVAGFALAFCLAYLDRWMNGSASAHLGNAIGAADERGVGYLWEIIVRKITMNLRILGSPYVIIALAGVAAVVAVAWGKLNASTRSLAESQPKLVRGVPAAGWGALAAFVFNDSGIVAAIFLFGAFFVTGLYFLFARPVRTA